jgi:hypothetical protein
MESRRSLDRLYSRPLNRLISQRFCGDYRDGEYRYDRGDGRKPEVDGTSRTARDAIRCSDGRPGGGGIHSDSEGSSGNKQSPPLAQQRTQERDAG